MSIFGDLDAATIKTNPFFIEKGDYPAEVTVAKFQTNRDEERQLYIQYTINDELSEYDKYKPAKTYTLVPEGFTAADLAVLPANDIKKIKRDLASLKRDLCGNPGNDRQKGLGVNLEDLNDPNWKPEVLVGTKVILGIRNFGDDGVNIQWVNLDE